MAHLTKESAINLENLLSLPSNRNYDISIEVNPESTLKRINSVINLGQLFSKKDFQDLLSNYVIQNISVDTLIRIRKGRWIFVYDIMPCLRDFFQHQSLNVENIERSQFEKFKKTLELSLPMYTSVSSKLVNELPGLNSFNDKLNQRAREFPMTHMIDEILAGIDEMEDYIRSTFTDQDSEWQKFKNWCGTAWEAISDVFGSGASGESSSGGSTGGSTTGGSISGSVSVTCIGNCTINVNSGNTDSKTKPIWHPPWAARSVAPLIDKAFDNIKTGSLINLKTFKHKNHEYKNQITINVS